MSSAAGVFIMGVVRRWIHRLLGLDVEFGEIKAALNGLDLDVRRLQGAVASLEKARTQLRSDHEYLRDQFNATVKDPLEGLQARVEHLEGQVDQLYRARDALAKGADQIRNDIAAFKAHVDRRFAAQGWRQCTHCQGAGTVYMLTSARTGSTLQVRCEECDGLGYVLPKPQPSEAS